MTALAQLVMKLLGAGDPAPAGHGEGALHAVHPPLARPAALPRLSVLTCLALAALYLPTFWKLFSFGWDNADYSHGPLVLGAFLWLLWRGRETLIGAASGSGGAETDPVPAQPCAAPAECAAPVECATAAVECATASVEYAAAPAGYAAHPDSSFPYPECCLPTQDSSSPYPPPPLTGGGRGVGEAANGVGNGAFPPTPTLPRKGGGSLMREGSLMGGGSLLGGGSMLAGGSFLAGGSVLGAASLLLLIFGLACYAIGAGHGSMAIEAFSVVPVLLGAGGYLFGRSFLKELMFPACFLLFLVPPPLVLTDLLTAPLKMLVATASAALLKGAGFLVSRNGATILMSDYSITVGDPCSGMRSLIALMSIGALYAHLLQTSAVKKTVLFCSTIPISVLANVVRLIALCLITFYLGEAAAEGFLHKFSGFVLFAVSLVSLFLLDVALHRRRAK